MNNGFLDGSAGEESTCDAGDRVQGSILGSGRCPGGGPINPLQYSSQENLTVREAWHTGGLSGYSECSKINYNDL